MTLPHDGGIPSQLSPLQHETRLSKSVVFGVRYRRQMLYSTAERFHWLRFETGRVPVPRETQSLYTSSPLSCNSRGSILPDIFYVHEYISHCRYTGLEIMAFQANSNEKPRAASYIWPGLTINLPGSGHTPLGGNKAAFDIYLMTCGYKYPRLLNKSKYSLIGRSRLEDSRLRLHLLKSHSHIRI